MLVLAMVKCSHKEGFGMTVRERLLALRLLEKQEKCPECIRNMGIHVRMIQKDVKEKEEKYV